MSTLNILVMVVAFFIGAGIVALTIYRKKHPKPGAYTSSWWRRNIHKADGSIDTSRVMKLAAMFFAVCSLCAIGAIFAKVGWVFFFTKTAKLILSVEALQTLAIAAGGIFTAIGFDYAHSRKTRS